MQEQLNSAWFLAKKAILPYLHKNFKDRQSYWIEANMKYRKAEHSLKWIQTFLTFVGLQKLIYLLNLWQKIYVFFYNISNAVFLLFLNN